MNHAPILKVPACRRLRLQPWPIARLNMDKHLVAALILECSTGAVSGSRDLHRVSLGLQDSLFLSLSLSVSLYVCMYIYT